ncbi:MAG: hypothetical protein NTU79_12995 [Planctomycetota bacterium]|nr:hypothetical protein [Planctomycetota bacterium]
MASDWPNASLIRDVDNSSLVTPLDALLIIDNLNSNGSRELTPRVQHAGVMFYDGGNTKTADDGPNCCKQGMEVQLACLIASELNLQLGNNRNHPRQ